MLTCGRLFTLQLNCLLCLWLFGLNKGDQAQSMVVQSVVKLIQLICVLGIRFWVLLMLFWLFDLFEGCSMRSSITLSIGGIVNGVIL